MCTPNAPRTLAAAPPPPDPFDQAVRASRAAARDQELRARGRRRTMIGTASGTGELERITGKTLLGQ